jgi:hypothetical protein
LILAFEGWTVGKGGEFGVDVAPCAGCLAGLDELTWDGALGMQRVIERG